MAALSENQNHKKISTLNTVETPLTATSLQRLHNFFRSGGQKIHTLTLQLNLATAATSLNMCKSSEITNKQIKSLQHESKQSNEELHLVQDKSKTKTKKPRPSNSNKTTKGSKKTWKCKFCGQAKWHSKPTDCPAYGQQRRICKKMNHFSKVCLSRKDSRGTVHFAEEAKVDDYDSEESILKVEEMQLKGKESK